MSNVLLLRMAVIYLCLFGNIFLFQKMKWNEKKTHTRMAERSSRRCIWRGIQTFSNCFWKLNARARSRGRGPFADSSVRAVFAFGSCLFFIIVPHGNKSMQLERFHLLRDFCLFQRIRCLWIPRHSFKRRMIIHRAMHSSAIFYRIAFYVKQFVWLNMDFHFSLSLLVKDVVLLFSFSEQLAFITQRERRPFRWHLF